MTHETEIMLFIHELNASRDQESEDAVMFQGVKFNLNASVSNEGFCLNMPQSMERLVGFLKHTE